MKSNNLSLKSLAILNENIEQPSYKSIDDANKILHIGVGNFHRSHQAYYLHQILQNSDSLWRIYGAGLMPNDIKMKESLEKQDYLYTLVAQESESEKVTVIGSICDFMHIPTEFDKFISFFTSEELKIVTLTVTEKGYNNTTDWDLDITSEKIQHDLNHPNEIPVTAIGLLAYGLKKRMQKNAPPITIMTCDNIPQNGEVLKTMINKFVNNTGDIKLEQYIEIFVKFPSSMVDRITPITTEEKKTYLENKYNIKDSVPVFSEDYIQWIIEDDFNVERPEWESVGVQIVDDVKPYELMKTRLLNGGHTALAFPSLLSGFVFVDDAMKSTSISNFVRCYMNEIKNTLEPVDGVDYDSYIDDLIKRFSNPAIKDRLLRLAEDTSSKFLNFIVSPLMILLEKGEEVPMITYVLASWIIFLNNSISDKSYELKDPRLDLIQDAASKSLVDATAFLSLKEIFPEEILKYNNFITNLNTKIKNILELGISNTIPNNLN